MIQRLQRSDSAIYYCAPRPTMTTGDSVPVQKHKRNAQEKAQATRFDPPCKIAMWTFLILREDRSHWAVNLRLQTLHISAWSGMNISTTEFEERFDAHLDEWASKTP
ncbi:unnamed protein product [Coregonus sp. 'balchen']|nr:unnamed protein product [Coregonus sp. 'balchen']